MDPNISIAPAAGFPLIEPLFTCSWHPDNLALSICLGHEELVEVDVADEEREDVEPAEHVEESMLCRDEEFADATSLRPRYATNSLAVGRSSAIVSMDTSIDADVEQET